MAEIMAHTTKLDKQGRLIIPAKIRKKLSLSEDTLLEIEILGNQLIIKKIQSITNEILDEWENNLTGMNIQIFSDRSELKGSEKWMSEEYVKNKIGI